MTEFTEWTKPCKAYDTIKGTSLTLSDVCEILYRKDAKFRNLLFGTRIRKVITENIRGSNGFMSLILKTTVYFDDRNRKPYVFVLKVPQKESAMSVMCTDDISANKRKQMKVVVDEMLNGHNTECEFYAQFGGAGCASFPRVWHTTRRHEGNCGTIIMEYIDGMPQEFWGNFSEAQVKSLIRQLAAFHARVLCMDERQWRGKYTKTLFTMRLAEEPREELRRIASIDPSFEELSRRMDKIIGVKYARHALIEAPDDLGLPVVLNHGDMWSGNILWNVVDGEPGDRVLSIIDWAFVFEGNLMTDIARFFIMNLDGDTRREYEQWMPQFYCDELARSLSKWRMDELCLDVDQVRTAYKLAAANQSTHLIVYPTFISDAIRERFPPDVCEAVRQKLLFRLKLALEDAITYVEEVAPQFSTP